MRKIVKNLQVGDLVVLDQPVVVRVVEVIENPLWVPKAERSAHYFPVPDKMVVFDPIGLVRDGTGQSVPMGSLLSVEVLDV